jgi:hypothetical protein
MAKVLREKKAYATTTLDDEHGVMWLHIPDLNLSIAAQLDQVDAELRMHDAVVLVALDVDVLGGVHQARILRVIEAGAVPTSGAKE